MNIAPPTPVVHRCTRRHSTKRFSQDELRALWIRRTRHLAQHLHHITTIAPESDTSLEVVSCIREAVKVLTGNMLMLEKTSALLFQRLARLQSVMIASPDYLQRAIDFPNFPLSDEHLRWYGIFDFIKPHQLAREGITHTYVHRFGDDLLRYNPDLGEEKRYKFPDPASETLPTRLNTPLSGPRVFSQSEGEVSGGYGATSWERLGDSNSGG
ncbi:hypothetical protein B0H19DRAFT_1080323 [Mycena capillaripes]|nr:hypothetical protein B0H19DRAFT_1080323 [Mycena capillaripes]